jgi:hypothetical protein
MQLDSSGLAFLNTLWKRFPPLMPKKNKLMVIDKIGLHGASVAIQRGATSVSEDDLLIGLHLGMAPDYVTFVCSRLGMTQDKKAAYERRAFEIDYVPLDAFWRDLATTAEKCGGEVREDALRPIFECYKDIGERDSIYIKTTDREAVPRELFVRFGHAQKWFDLAAMAKAAGVLDVYDNRAYKAYAAICNAIPAAGSMVDISTQGSIHKFYAFLPRQQQPLSKLRKCADLPAALFKNIPLLDAWGYKRFGIFGVDLHNHSLNFYYYTAQTRFDQTCARTMLTALGFPVPSADILAEIGQAAMIYFTFTYASDRIERVCFTKVYEDDTAIPVALAPSLKDYIETAPIKAVKRNLILGYTFHSAGSYLKVELDYKASLGIPGVMQHSGLYPGANGR